MLVPSPYGVRVLLPVGTGGNKCIHRSPPFITLRHRLLLAGAHPVTRSGYPCDTQYRHSIKPHPQGDSLNPSGFPAMIYHRLFCRPGPVTWHGERCASIFRERSEPSCASMTPMPLYLPSMVTTHPRSEGWQGTWELKKCSENGRHPSSCNGYRPALCSWAGLSNVINICGRVTHRLSPCIGFRLWISELTFCSNGVMEYCIIVIHTFMWISYIGGSLEFFDEFQNP